MSVVEAKFSFLQMQGESLPAQAMELGQSSFGIAPETLDTVDVVGTEGKLVVAMVDSRCFSKPRSTSPS